MPLRVNELHRVQVNLSQKIDQQGEKVWVATMEGGTYRAEAPTPREALQRACESAAADHLPRS
jgi:hypothetical protein